MLDPEELPLPGLGASFSTLSQSSLGSMLLLEKKTRKPLKLCPKTESDHKHEHRVITAVMRTSAHKRT